MGRKIFAAGKSAGRGAGRSGPASGLFGEHEPIEVERSHHFHEAFKFDRFDKVAVGSEFVGAVDVRVFLGRGEDDDGQAFETRLSAQPRDDFKTVFARHFQVHEQETGQREFFAVRIWAVPAKIGNGLLAIPYGVERIGYLRLLEGAFHEENVVFVILGQQYGLNPDTAHQNSIKVKRAAGKYIFTYKFAQNGGTPFSSLAVG